MADGGHDGNPRAGDCARQRLIVEGRQVFERPAAARNDDHIDAPVFVETPQRRNDFTCRLRALHACRRD